MTFIEFYYTVLIIAPTASPQNPSSIFYANSASTINFTWYTPPVEKQNGIIIYYIIRMTEVETNIGFEFTSNFTYIYLTSLHPYYSYTFQLAAVTVSEGPFSNAYTVLMPEDGKLLNFCYNYYCTITISISAPTSPPLNISTVVLSSKTVYIYWQPPPFEHQNGIIRKYEIFLIGEDNITHIDATQNTSLTIKYLHPNYMYNITIRAVTILEGVQSSAIYFVTLEDCE